MRQFWTVLLGAFWVLSIPAAAQMGSHLKEEFHDAEAYGIRIIDGISALRSALHDEEVRVLCFQSFSETLDEESHAELLEWVRGGKSVWFYDARLAPAFGMKDTYFTGEEFRTKPEQGVLGGKKRSGLATVGVSLGTHAVQTGVGQVTIFLPEIEREDEEELLYGGVELEGDTVALLQSSLDSPALVACRREGKGFIVFKALLWNEPLSGDRFQMNLLEYSAGFQVPGPAGVGKVGDPPGPEAEFWEGEPAVPLQASSGQPLAPSTASPDSEPETPDEKNGASSSEGGGESPVSEKVETETVGPWSLELQDGTVVSGELELKLIEFETGSSSLKLSPDKVESLVFGDSIRLDRIVTKSGKEQSGLLLSAPIRFRTERGVEEFEKEDLIKLSRSE